MASGGGSLLSRYNPENNRFSTFRVEDTLTREPISRISTICQDSFGDIWIAGYACELAKFEVSRLTFTCNKPDGGESYVPRAQYDRILSGDDDARHGSRTGKLQREAPQFRTGR
ncbi:MAG: hypothetical protein ACLVK4_16295 [Alistipes shahii]|uniref:hypothetical protein n=1 Tax=Alistipes shahii TaxID=328814 RepID=UPI00399C85B6